jgi:glycosyltransferase involved in cell wall biosynthesis
MSPEDTEFVDYIWNAIATIYIPIDEDFGMSPVESMSAWKPVLWVNEWWLKETIIDKKTWVLIDPKCEIDDIVEAVKYLSPKRCLEMKDDCILRAKEFSLDKFKKQLEIYVK